MENNSKIYIAGRKNLIAVAIAEVLKDKGYTNIIFAPEELDLLDQSAVAGFFDVEKPEYVFYTYGKFGGIFATNNYPADFIYENLQIQNNVIHSAYKIKVKKLLFLGSSCIYPSDCPQPIKEEYLFSGKLEKTSESYAIAKIAGIKMCQAYWRQYGFKCILAIPATIYGPQDDFSLETGHVIPALFKKFHAAKVGNEKKVVVWGTGKPRRELIYAQDLAEACIFLMQNYDSPEIINVGTGQDLTINELALLIKDAVGFKGDIVFDASKPDGVAQKLLDSTKIKKIGWQHKVSLIEGIRRTYNWYQRQVK